jgi:hypothetical protein
MTVTIMIGCSDSETDDPSLLTRSIQVQVLQHSESQSRLALTKEIRVPTGPAQRAGPLALAVQILYYQATTAPAALP